MSWRCPLPPHQVQLSSWPFTYWQVRYVHPCHLSSRLVLPYVSTPCRSCSCPSCPSCDGRQGIYMLLLLLCQVNKGDGLLPYVVPAARCFFVAAILPCLLAILKNSSSKHMLCVCSIHCALCWGQRPRQSSHCGVHEGRLCPAHAARRPWTSQHLPRFGPSPVQHAVPQICKSAEVKLIAVSCLVHQCLHAGSR